MLYIVLACMCTYALMLTHAYTQTHTLLYLLVTYRMAISKMKNRMAISKMKKQNGYFKKWKQIRHESGRLLLRPGMVALIGAMLQYYLQDRPVIRIACLPTWEGDSWFAHCYKTIAPGCVYWSYVPMRPCYLSQPGLSDMTPTASRWAALAQSSHSRGPQHYIQSGTCQSPYFSTGRHVHRGTTEFHINHSISMYT